MARAPYGIHDRERVSYFVKRGKCTGSIDETLELGFIPKVTLDETRSRFNLSLVSASMRNSIEMRRKRKDESVLKNSGNLSRILRLG